MDVTAALIAKVQPTKLMQPRQGTFNQLDERKDLRNAERSRKNRFDLLAVSLAHSDRRTSRRRPQTDPFAIYQSQAIPLGSKSHLFIDEMGISHREGVRFVVNAPDISGPGAAE